MRKKGCWRYESLLRRIPFRPSWSYNAKNGRYPRFGWVDIDRFLQIKNRCFKEIIGKMRFPEVVNTGLGYSESNTKGSGISGKLSSQLATSCVEIVQAGIQDPAFFTLLPFIEEGIGADRISDMTIDILLEEFLLYTQRIAKEKGIRSRQLRYRNVPYQVPFIDGRPYLLIPHSLLANLPIARSYDDIDKVCNYNRELRRRV